jgi:hypothetical protein
LTEPKADGSGSGIDKGENVGFLGLSWKDVGLVVLEGSWEVTKQILSAGVIIVLGLSAMASSPAVVVVKK